MHADTLKRLRIVVLVLSFCPDPEMAQRWNREVGSPFLHLIDPAAPGVPGDAGSTYLEWGFRKSFLGVWSPESLRFYSDQKLAGRETHPAYGQDVHRMGGDILLDGCGRVVLDHYSKTNQDRPMVKETLLPMARALDAQRRAGWGGKAAPAAAWVPRAEAALAAAAAYLAAAAAALHSGVPQDFLRRGAAVAATACRALEGRMARRTGHGARLAATVAALSAGAAIAVGAWSQRRARNAVASSSLKTSPSWDLLEFHDEAPKEQEECKS